MNSRESSGEGRGLGDTVQKFRDYFSSILTREGDQQLAKIFSHQRELGQKIEDPQERSLFQAIMNQLEMELLPDQEEGFLDPMEDQSAPQDPYPVQAPSFRQ